MTRWPRIAVGLIVIFAMAETASACPFCKEALSSSGGDLVSGFFYSILFMLSMPLMIFTGMGTYFYVLVRRARAAQEAANRPGAAADTSPQA
jgi:hypothetical protein